MELDKPVSLTMKAWIIRNMSVRILMQESVIETVVNHQFETALAALETCNSLEFSGFGKFFFNRPKAIKKLESLKEVLKKLNDVLEDSSITDIKRKNTEVKSEMIKKIFENLNIKVNGCISDMGGVAQQTIASEGIKGTNKEGGRDENGDLQGLSKQLQIPQDSQT
jgi:hypothetical protein